jgi:hypothetical protein
MTYYVIKKYLLAIISFELSGHFESIISANVSPSILEYFKTVVRAVITISAD